MSKVEFTIIEDNGAYAIIWAVFKKSSDIGKQYNVWGDISLPYFVDKKELNASIGSEGVVLNGTKLLVGLLLRYSAIPPFTVTHKVKPYFRDILVNLLRQYTIAKKYVSLDYCIHTISDRLKGEYGASVDGHVLKMVSEILP